MRKVAIFTEGQSELIFIRTLLNIIVDLNRLSYECLKLHSDSLQRVPYNYSAREPQIHFCIVNVQNDERLIAAIKNREKDFFRKGYEKIIGLRDLYCDIYDKRSKGCINDNVSRQIIQGANEEISMMSEPSKIRVFFSIMELEAWFLSMYSVLAKINNLLSVDYIENNLGYNLCNIDPQTSFYRPSTILKNIFQLCGLRYDKSMDDIEVITAKMDENDLQIAIRNGRCSSLRDLYCEIKHYHNLLEQAEN